MSQSTDQTKVVKEQMQSQNQEVTEDLRVPGIENLHLRTPEEIGSVLANVIKSRSGVTSMTYVMGSHIKVTYNGNPHSQLR